MRPISVTKWQDTATVDFLAAALDSAALPQTVELLVRSGGIEGLGTTRIVMKSATLTVEDAGSGETGAPFRYP